MLGAATLQVTTGIMQYGYRIVEDMASGLSHYLADQGFDSLQEMVGLANNNIVPAEDLDRSYIVYPRINLDKCVGCGRCYISCYDGGHRRWNGARKHARRIVIPRNAWVVCFVVTSARWVVLSLGK